MQCTERDTIPKREFRVLPRAVSSQPPAGALISSLNNLRTAVLGTLAEAALHLKHHQHSVITPSWEVDEKGARGSGLDYRSMYGAAVCSAHHPTFTVEAGSGQYISSPLTLFKRSQESGFIKAKLVQLNGVS